MSDLLDGSQHVWILLAPLLFSCLHSLAGLLAASAPLILAQHVSPLCPTCLSVPHTPPSLDARCEVVERRARHELARAQQRLHLVDGFLCAMRDMDAVVAAIRQAPDGAAASAALQASRVWAGTWDPAAHVCHTAGPFVCLKTAGCRCHAGCCPWVASCRGKRPHCRRAPAPPVQGEPFGLSREQAEGVLGMTLRRLTSLEEGKLREEQGQLRAK